MFSIYQFGFKVFEDPKMWQEQITNLFGIEFKIHSIINEYPNIEKNWLESIRPSLSQLKEFELLGEKVLMVNASFNRYQPCVYLTLVIDGDVREKCDFFNRLRERFGNYVTGFIDSFDIPFKEPEGEIEKVKYTEVLCFENPVLVTDYFNDNTYIKTEVKSGSLCYKFYNNPQKKARYSRKFKQVYISNDINKDILNHFHSIFVLFHRSYEYYRELSMMDNTRMILFEISAVFNRIWPTERMRFFMLHRVWHAYLYNKTFFNVLELSAQLDTLINQLVIYNQKIHDKYEKQYERVLNNFNIESLESCKIYDELLHYLKSPYNYRKHSIDNIKNLYEPTDEQICRLRSDNDSRVNLAIQGIMSILTIVFFVWGVMAAWYQTTISYAAIISDKVLFNSYYWPAIFSIITIGTALVSIAIALFISNRYSRSFTKEVQRVIISQELNIQVIESKINNINDCKNINRRLLLITELFSIITAFLTINSNNNKLEQFKNDILKAIREVDNC
jgi:hypothetical protein